MSSASTSKFIGDAKTLRDYYTKQLVKYYLAAGIGETPSLPYAQTSITEDFCRTTGLDPARMADPEYLRDALHRLAEGKDASGAYFSQFFVPPLRSMIAQDVTLSAPKSVSVAFAIGDEEQRRAIELAHRAAVAAAHNKIRADLGFSRTGKDGLTRVSADIAIFSIHQTDARPAAPGAPPMPHLHSHNVIPNVAVCGDGKVRAIDFRGLDPLSYSTIYQQTLARELRNAGFTLRQGRHSFEIATVGDVLVDRFSIRAAEIREAAAMMAAAEGLDFETLSSSERKLLERRAQQQKLDKRPEFEQIEACLPVWLERAGEDAPASLIGGDEADYEQCVRRCREALQETAESIAVLDRSKVDAIIAANTLAIALPDDERAKLEGDLFSEFFISHTSSRMMAQGAIDQNADGAKIERAVSKIALDAERYALKASETLAAQKAGLKLDIDAALAGKTLTDEQAAAIRGLANGQQLEFLRGGAGVGKTYALSPLVEAQLAAGGKVYGAAVANQIAFALTDAGIAESNAMSLQKLAGMAGSGKLKLDKKTLIVLDEASMIGLLEINKLFDAAEKSGARIVIVGDDSQINAVGLQSLELIQEGIRRAGTEARSVLTTVRQKTDVEKAIAAAFRNGTEAERALIYLDENSRLKFGEDRAHVLRMCAHQWNAARDAGHNHVFIAATNREAQDVALAIRAEREKRGELRGEEVFIPIVGNGGVADDAENSMLLREGDRIRFFDRVSERTGKRPRNLCVNGTVARFVNFEQDENGNRFIVAEHLDKHDKPKKNEDAVAACARELANADPRTRSVWEKLPKKTRDTLMDKARQDPDIPTSRFRVPIDKIRDLETGRLRLAYADASTVHSAQGISARIATGVSLDGTKTINSRLGYVTASRHEKEFTFICNSQALDLEIRQGGVTGVIERHDRVSALARAFTRDIRRPFAVSAIDDLKIADDREGAMSKEDIRAILAGEPRKIVEKKSKHAAEHIDLAKAESAVASVMRDNLGELQAAFEKRISMLDFVSEKFDRARDRLRELYKSARAKIVERFEAHREEAELERAAPAITKAVNELRQVRAENAEKLQKVVPLSEKEAAALRRSVESAASNKRIEENERKREEEERLRLSRPAMR